MKVGEEREKRAGIGEKRQKDGSVPLINDWPAHDVAGDGAGAGGVDRLSARPAARWGAALRLIAPITEDLAWTIIGRPGPERRGGEEKETGLGRRQEESERERSAEHL